VCHQTVSGAPGSYDSELFTFGFLRPRSAIIHRTVRCTSGATASQRNGRLQRSPATLQCVDSSRRSQSSHQRRTGQSIVPVRCGTGTVRCHKKTKLQRSNPSGWVAWLTHRTVRCAHRQQPTPTVELVIEGYKYPVGTRVPGQVVSNRGLSEAGTQFDWRQQLLC
jgi:hypothetical protein